MMAQSFEAGMMLLEEFDPSAAVFDLQSSQAGATLSRGTPFAWQVAGDVYGANQGLASYYLTLELHQGSATGPLANVSLAAADVAAFHVGGSNAAGAVTSPLPAGGPGMRAIASRTNASGRLDGFGAGYAMPWRYSQTAKRMTRGVGLADRKAALLGSETADYILHGGQIDTSALPAGHYVLVLTPQWAKVLRGDLDFEADVDRSFAIDADVSGSVTIEFTIAE
jgi:hypothetical protein